MTVMDFVLPPSREAHEPPEARGVPRDGVRMLVVRVGAGTVHHHRFTDLPGLLRPGDVLVVNTSATLPAATTVIGQPLAVHFSTELPDGRWLVELRRAAGKASEPFTGAPGTYPLPGGASVTLHEPYSRGRLWYATVDTDVPAFLRRYGQPIRYGYVPRAWPLHHYQTVFATEPGSAEMPSAGRPFSEHLVTRLVSAGVLFAPVLLHTGVASPEAHERPYPERFAVSASTARLVNHARANGGRIIAVGTTAVRAIETASTVDGIVEPRHGWTDLVVTPQRGVLVVDGLLTGFHEPRASHLDLLGAVARAAAEPAERPLAGVVSGLARAAAEPAERPLAGVGSWSARAAAEPAERPLAGVVPGRVRAAAEVLDRCYAEAIAAGYLWHEFGDVNLLLP